MNSIYGFLRKTIKQPLCSLRDFRTTRHILVFESDDWGSIRMSNKQDWEELKRLGYAVDKRPYERFDTLESSQDMEALFDVLFKHKDCKGNHPIITANTLMANPDFERIEQTGFKEYHYETVADTYIRYYGDMKVLTLMKQGLDEGLFLPQSHGREHFNVSQWMRGLLMGDEDLLTAFHHKMCGVAPKLHPERGNKMMIAFMAENEEEQLYIDEIVKEGLQLFEREWGYKSRTFVAPCYLWDRQTERVLVGEGVKLVQTARVSKPTYKSPPRYFYAGQKEDGDLFYSIRNCHFEPATKEGGENADDLLKQIDSIFDQRKIAVCSSHRINYVSGIEEANRSQTLHILDDFLTRLLKIYPDVEFLSSDQLIDVFEQ